MQRVKALLLLGSLFMGLDVVHAAQIDVFASSASIAPGDPLTVTITGDSQGERAGFIAARLEYDASLIPSDAKGPFVLETSFGFIWDTVPSEHGVCGVDFDPPNTCRAVSAFADQVIGTLDLLPGTLSVFEFDTSGVPPGSLLAFQAIPDLVGGFFSAGPSEIVTVRVVPEPGTAGLVSLGLAALVAGSRATLRQQSHVAQLQDRSHAP